MQGLAVSSGEESEHEDDFGEVGERCVVRDSNSGHQLLLPPANLASHICVPDHAGTTSTRRLSG